MLAAIDNLSEIAAKQRVAILGDMKELGGQTETEHQRIISELTKHPNTKVYLVGESFKLTQNHDYQIFSVIEKLKIYLEENELKDSTILLKGSRSMKLETLLKLL